MKLTPRKAIFIAAFSILVVFVVISSVSVYYTTQQDLQIISGRFDNLFIEGNTLKMNVSFNERNNGLLPSQIKIFGQTLTVNPSSSVNDVYSLTIKQSANDANWAEKGFVCLFSVFVSEFFQSINISSFTRHVSVNVPSLFSSFCITGINNNTINAEISGLIPIVTSFFSISIILGTKVIGTLSYDAINNQPISGNVTLTGLIDQNIQNPGELNFSFMGFSW